MLAVSFPLMAFMMLKFLNLLCWGFYHECTLYFVKCLSASIEWSYGSYSFFYGCDVSQWLICKYGTTPEPRNKSHRIVLNDFFYMYCWIRFASIFWKFLLVCSSVVLTCSSLFQWYVYPVLVSGYCVLLEWIWQFSFLFCSLE